MLYQRVLMLLGQKKLAIHLENSFFKAESSCKIIIIIIITKELFYNIYDYTFINFLHLQNGYLKEFLINKKK